MYHGSAVSEALNIYKYLYVQIYTVKLDVNMTKKLAKLDNASAQRSEMARCELF